LGDGSWRSPAVEYGASWAGPNLVRHSEDLTNAVWTKGNFTVTSNIDGTADALIENTNTTVAHQLMQTASVVGGTEYQWTVELKAAGRNLVGLYMGGITWSPGAVVYVDLATGKTSGPGLTVEPLDNGYFRVTRSNTATVTGFGQFYLLSAMGTLASPQTTYTGDGTSGFYVRNAQINAGSVRSEYMPTGTAVITTGALIPAAPGASVAANGNAINIPAGKLDRLDQLRLDPTGGVLSPHDYETGLNHLVDSTGNQWVESTEGDW
jgi:hypothetical protein